MDRRFRSVVFDFDYTLADSSRGVIDCISYALDSMGFEAATAEAACRTIGLSLPDTFVALVGERYAEQSDEFSRLFVQQAGRVMSAETVVLDTVPATVEMLRGLGLGLGIVSTKFRHRIVEILRREDLLAPFDIIIGGEDVTRHKPHPEGLLAAIDRVGCAPGDSLYVGDSIVDAETAKRAQVSFAAVLSGTTLREAFASQPVAAILENLSELPVLLNHPR